eukprot:1512846-Pyramimonas_sp.AAC.1
MFFKYDFENIFLSLVRVWPQCEELAQSLSEDMREKGLWAKTLTLKLKGTDFQVMIVSAREPTSPHL